MHTHKERERERGITIYIYTRTHVTAGAATVAINEEPAVGENPKFSRGVAVSGIGAAAINLHHL